MPRDYNRTLVPLGLRQSSRFPRRLGRLLVILIEERNQISVPEPLSRIENLLLTVGRNSPFRDNPRSQIADNSRADGLGL
jgi:hypothetical protein